VLFLPPHGAAAPSGPVPPHCRSFTVTIRHTTIGRAPLDEGSARCRHLYLTTHNSYKRQTSVPSAGFEPAIPASDRPQTRALDRAATGVCIYSVINSVKLVLAYSLIVTRFTLRGSCVATLFVDVRRFEGTYRHV
jgi:hypothetical protein